jgi:1-acyl-sn-glycerol-3-phosphate acyltransferase
MQNFDAIRPYRDDEADAVIARLRQDPELLRAAAALYAPRLSRWLPWLARRAAGRFIALRTRPLHSVKDVQAWLSGHMARVIRTSIDELTITGLEHLQAGKPYLFISNHRDIVMDSALLNYLLYQAGHETMRTAVGDNLLKEDYAADLMRLNKSFVVQRRVTGAKALFQALSLTSAYIRHSLEEGASIWIAQREGRAKDGWDRTDPAVLKMLALAWRDGSSRFDDFVQRVQIVPVAVSYELDPCDRRKAHELAVTERTGTYVKTPNEDLESMVDGIVGYKGRVHFTLAPPLAGNFADADELAAELDRHIVRGLEVFPTHVDAAELLGRLATTDAATRKPLPRVMDAWQERLDTCPADELPQLLAGYANVFANKSEIESRAAERPARAC